MELTRVDVMLKIKREDNYYLIYNNNNDGK